MKQARNPALLLAMVAGLIDDFNELMSRGTNHPLGDEIAGRIRVQLQQLTSEIDAPPAAADPVDVQLSRLADSVESLGVAVKAIKI